MVALTDWESIYDYPDMITKTLEQRDLLAKSIKSAELHGHRSGLNSHCENCNINFRFSLHSHVSPVYREACVTDPKKKPDGSLIYSMIANRELSEIMAYGQSIRVPSPPLQTSELKTAAFKRRSLKPLLQSVNKTELGGQGSPLYKLFCPVCNRASMRIAKGATKNEVELGCDACRASFVLTRTDGGNWSSVTFRPNISS